MREVKKKRVAALTEARAVELRLMVEGFRA